jgi:uncharacterized Zn finger protein
MKIIKRFCPKCGSEDIDIAAGPLKIHQKEYILPPDIENGISFECKKCGYRGIFPEREIKTRKNKKIRIIKKNESLFRQCCNN